jgi:hypothetical protein
MGTLLNKAWRNAMVCTLAAVASTAWAGPVGSVFNPNDYTALNSGAALNYNSGTLTFNTDNGSVSHDVDGSLGTGAVDEPNASGNVKMTVFTFSSINLGSGVSIVVTGRRGLVLASQGDLTFDANMSVAGTAGQAVQTQPTNWGQTQGRGGPGADGQSTSAAGNAGGATESDPPGAYSGDGGFVYGGDWQNPRTGRGVGGAVSVWDGWGSPIVGGGGYGGNGGSGASASGGSQYGDLYLTNLLGGSGGGGAGRNAYTGLGNPAVTGGGGGSLELVARGTLSVGGTLTVSGGGINFATFFNNGSVPMGSGGGSGGGALLAGNAIVFSGAINARGGSGASYNNSYKSGNGGGRVAFYVGNFWSKTVEKLKKVNGDSDPADGQGTGGTDFEGGKDPFGLTFSGTVDVRMGTGGNGGAKGSFYALYVPPPAGTVFIIR